MDWRVSEWLEADGLGGFSSAPADGVRTRRHHALLLAAPTEPPTPVVLVNGFDAWLELPDATIPLTTQHYAPDVLHPDGASRIVAFEREPWPRWTLRPAEGVDVVHELLVAPGLTAVALSWRLWNVPGRRAHAAGRVELRVRPFLSGRECDALHRENPAFRFDALEERNCVSWHPYATLPAVTTVANGRYTHAPEWYRNFLLDGERQEGRDHLEDLASPGEFRFDLTRGEAVLLLVAGVPQEALAQLPGRGSPETALSELRRMERRRRRQGAARLECAAEAYVISGEERQAIVPRYPGRPGVNRETLAAARGLCLATGQLDDARAVLLDAADVIEPVVAPGTRTGPGFEQADLPLWFALTTFEYLAAVDRRRARLGVRQRRRLLEAVGAVLDHCAQRDDPALRLGDDGLLAVGEPGTAPTWMDARQDGRPVTPRVGKPVEIEALWLNVLRFAADPWPRWDEIYRRGLTSFRERFWDSAAGYLADVVDVDHEPGTRDMRLRPNQLFAIGGLPFMLLDDERSRRMLEPIEARLWTPMGPRTLAPGEPDYRGACDGDAWSRAGAAHQGTVWMWLAGPFIEAWVRVHGGRQDTRAEARARFLHPLIRHLDETGLGHLGEMADGDPPHTPRGSRFHALAMAEVLRVHRGVLAEPVPRRRASSSALEAVPAPAQEVAVD
jgi:predicted glycogen debranching enzyme